MKLLDTELDRLAVLWQFHRHGGCRKTGAVSVVQSAGSGIGTATKLVCPCGQVLDMTDYYAW